MKNSYGLSTKAGVKPNVAPSANKHSSSSGKFGGNQPSLLKKSQAPPAPSRKTESGNHLKAKLSSGAKITKPTLYGTKVGEKRTHSDMSGTNFGMSQFTASGGSEAPEPKKKKKVDSAGHALTQPALNTPIKTRKPIELREQEDVDTAAEFAEWLFRCDPDDEALSGDTKQQVFRNLTVPGVTTGKYLVNLASSLRFQHITKRAHRIFRGQEEVNDAVVVTFILADSAKVDSTNTDAPHGNAWIAAQLRAGLGTDAALDWKKDATYRVYRRFLRYIQACSCGKCKLDAGVARGLLEAARQVRREINPPEPPAAPTEPMTETAEQLDSAPQLAEASVKQPKHDNIAGSNVNANEAASDLVAVTPPPDAVIELE